MTHFPISKAAIIAIVTQLVSFVAGFGVINSTKTGIVIAAATAVVNAAFLIANAIHAVAANNKPKPLPVPPK